MSVWKCLHVGLGDVPRPKSCIARFVRQTRKTTYVNRTSRKFFSRLFPEEIKQFEKFRAHACVKRARASDTTKECSLAFNRRDGRTSMAGAVTQNYPELPTAKTIEIERRAAENEPKRTQRKRAENLRPALRMRVRREIA